jgi:predicted SprT family Zn-dependent metalloprotease
VADSVDVRLCWSDRADTRTERTTERTPATASRTVAARPTESTSTCASTPTYLHKTPLPARLALATSLYQKFNLLIFDGALPADLDISWNKRLTSTAGMTHYKRRIDARTSLPVYSCRIELATKVLDTAAKLERTLIHEMCHCAAWMIDHVAKPPHGAVFKKYAQRAMTIVPGVDVSTCHNYEIFYAYRWACGSCGVEYGRHSKSIDVEKKVCGGCRGRLAFLGRFRRGADGVVEVVAGRLGGGGGGGDGSPEKKMSGYSVFVKEHFHGTKLEMEGEKAAGGRGGTVLASEVMKRLAARWAREKRVGEREEERVGKKSLAHSLLLLL